MGYEIVGAVYDENGNALSAEELEAQILARYGVGAAFDRVALARQFGTPQRQQFNRLAPGINALGGNGRVALNTQQFGAPPPAMPMPRITPSVPGPVDEVPLPISSTGTVAAGAQVTIAVTSQIIFRPQRLIVPDSIAQFFTIDSINVGNVPLFAGTGSLPAEVFTPESSGANIRKVTAAPGLQIVVQVTNIDSVAHAFRAALFGPGSQPSGGC